MDAFNLNQKNKNIFARLYENLTGNPFTTPFTQNHIKNNTEASCYILDKGNPYYHYFLAKEDEKKENLVLIYKSLCSKRITIATCVFTLYNVAKSILWQRGYFAYFFYHTRNMSFIIYLMSLVLIKKNFDANLIRNDCFRYHEKG